MKVSKIIAGLAIVPVLAFSTPVYADSPGQLLGGSNVYVTKNVTQNGSYGSSASVKACGDVIQFSILLSNTQFGKLSDIVVKTTVPATNGNSTMTAATSLGGTSGTEGTVAINGMTGNQKLAYVNGSTKLYDGNNALVKTLPDGIAGNGINVGELNGSTKEFVNFQAKVNCETTPPPTTPNKPAELVKTGAGDVAALFAVVAIAGAVAYNWILRRQTR